MLYNITVKVITYLPLSFAACVSSMKWNLKFAIMRLISMVWSTMQFMLIIANIVRPRELLHVDLEYQKLLLFS